MAGDSLPKLKPVTFILGTPRSGTTLLRVMLAGHPALFSPPEMLIAPFEEMKQRTAHLSQRFWEKGGLRLALMHLEGLDVAGAKDRVRALDELTVPHVYALLQEHLGDRLLVDKCPHLCASPDALRRLEEWFPEPRYLWLVRHPGSVTRSIEHQPMSDFMIKGYTDDTREVWHYGNMVLKEFLHTIPENRWAMVRYEDILENPKKEMERACRLFDVPFHEATLDPYEGDRMRVGKKGARAIGDPGMPARGKIDPALATKWLDGFDPRCLSSEARALAKELGYDLDEMELPPVAKVSEGLDSLWDVARAVEREIRLPLDLDAVEGRRFLLRMLFAAVDTFVENEDPERPAFHHVETPTRKMFADCLDTDYLRAPILLGPGRAYRVRGQVPKGTLYAGVQLYGKGGRIGNRLRDEELRLDDEGKFEVVVSTEEHEGLWLAAEGDETAVMVRQYYADRREEAPLTVSIERVGELAPPEPLDAERFAEGLDRAKRMVRSVFKRTTDAYKMASVMALNRFVEIPPDQLFPTPDNRYLAAWYRLAPDERILIRGKLPAARYFGVSLCNAWLESYDYQRHPVSLNHSQIEAEEDGTFELCLAHHDPGHPNWLSTAGHEGGYVIARFLLAEGSLPEMSLEVVKAH